MLRTIIFIVLIISAFALTAVFILRDWRGLTGSPRVDSRYSASNASSTFLNIPLPQAMSTTSARVPDAFVEQSRSILQRPYRIPVTLPASAKESLRSQIDGLRQQLFVSYDSLAPWLELGTTLQVIEDYVGARDAWEFASTIRPHNNLSFRYLGHLYGYYLHQNDLAIRAYRRAIVNDVTDAASYLDLADFYWDTQIVAFRERIPTLLLDGVGTATNKFLIFVRLGRYYVDTKDIAAALRFYEAALEIDPANVSLRGIVADLKP